MTPDDRIPFLYQAERRRARVRQVQMAAVCESSINLLYKIERGETNPRVGLMLRIIYAFAYFQNVPVYSVLERLLPDEAFELFAEVESGARAALADPNSSLGRLSTKQLLVQRAQQPLPPYVLGQMRFVRLQELYGRSSMSRIATVEVSGVSSRRLGDFFDISAPTSGNMTLPVLMALSATYAPVLQADARTTLEYILKDDLEAIEAERQLASPGNPGMLS